MVFGNFINSFDQLQRLFNICSSFTQRPQDKWRIFFCSNSLRVTSNNLLSWVSFKWGQTFFRFSWLTFLNLSMKRKKAALVKDFVPQCLSWFISFKTYLKLISILIKFGLVINHETWDVGGRSLLWHYKQTYAKTTDNIERPS